MRGIPLVRASAARAQVLTLFGARDRERAGRLYTAQWSVSLLKGTVTRVSRSLEL